ncbi:MAG TPA: murein biosynthesis integral membrane protein MurJ [Phycisphaerales bacterium]
MADDSPVNAGPTSTTGQSSDHAFGGVLAAAIRVVASFTLLSRFTGLARDLLTARLFGDTAVGSAFNAAFQIPNVFRRLFGEGALSAAFLPEYTTLKREAPDAADQLASLVMRLLTLVTGIIVLVIEAGLLVALLLNLDHPDRALSLRLMMLMLPMMPMVCTTAILGGMLQSHGRFGPSAAAPVILNLVMIAAALVPMLWPGVSVQTGAYLVGAGAVLASVLQIAWSLHALRGRVRWTRATADARDAGRRVLSRFVPVVVGLGTLQLNTWIDTLIAMWPIWIGPTMFGLVLTLDDSSNSILSYTSRLYQFPLGVFGIAVATAVFPLLSRTAKDPAAFQDVLQRGVRLSLFIGIPASVGLVLVREDLVRTMFGTFSAEGLSRSALVVACYAPAVWAYSLNHVLTRAFYARGDTKTPMRIAVAMVAINLALNLTLIWWLREAGLALATGSCAMIQAIVVGVVAARRLHVRILDRALIQGVLKLCLLAVLMGLAVAASNWLFTAAGMIDGRWRSHFLRLLVATAVGAGTYAAAAFVFRAAELRWLLQRGPKGAGAEEMVLD